VTLIITNDEPTDDDILDVDLDVYDIPTPELDAQLTDEDNREDAFWYGSPNPEQRYWDDDNDDDYEDDCIPENVVCESTSWPEPEGFDPENEVNRKIRVQSEFDFDEMERLELEAERDEARRQRSNDISMEDVLGSGVKRENR
jgi:hypothetical protein